MHNDAKHNNIATTTNGDDGDASHEYYEYNPRLAAEYFQPALRYMFPNPRKIVEVLGGPHPKARKSSTSSPRDAKAADNKQQQQKGGLKGGDASRRAPCEA